MESLVGWRDWSDGEIRGGEIRVGIELFCHVIQYRGSLGRESSLGVFVVSYWWVSSQGGRVWVDMVEWSDLEQEELVSRTRSDSEGVFLSGVSVV